MKEEPLETVRTVKAGSACWAWVDWLGRREGRESACWSRLPLGAGSAATLTTPMSVATSWVKGISLVMLLFGWEIAVG